MSYAKHAPLLEGPIVPSLLRLAVPIVLANILASAYQLTDAFWVGRLGGSAVAAVSISFPVIFVLIAVGLGFGIAGSTLVAQYMGAGNQRMVNHVAAQTLLMVALTSVILGAIGYVIAPGLLRLMGVAPEVYDGALQFMRVSFVGLVTVFGFAMFQAVLRGVGQVTLPLYITAGTVLLNFLFDPIFIFGWGPFPEAGVAGAAYATLVTQTLAALIGLLALLTGKYGIHLQWSDFTPDWVFVKRTFVLGFPATIEQSARGLGMMVMTFLIATFGTVAIAAYGIGSNIFMFVLIPAMGLSMATSALVGQHIGAGKIERATRIAYLSAGIAFVTLQVIGILLFLFAHAIVAFFVPTDPAVVQTGARFLRIFSLSFGALGLQLALIGVFRAAGRMMTTMALAVIGQWVLQFPLAYLLGKHTARGLDGLWWAFPIAMVTSTVIATAWFLRGDWKIGRLTTDEVAAEVVTEEILIEEGVR
ncbi:MAG TPA: MATE family efflux transporter [Vicinamibacterales bacterium]|nr:MATE family efflux transporter [Vicinamibacterales bacterium]